MPAATIPGDAESGKANPGFEGTMMVMARIRPFNESEQHCERALTAGDKQSVSIVHENYPEKSYKFDAVFGEDATQVRARSSRPAKTTPVHSPVAR